MRCPNIEFRAGKYGPKSNNINFARDHAQEIANQSGQSVDIIQVCNGVDSGTLHTIEPRVCPLLKAISG